VQDLDHRQGSPEDLPALRKVAFFQGLPEPDLALFASLLREVQVDEGAFVFHRGEEVQAFYVVKEGAIDLVAETASGDPVRIARRRPGEAVGETALLDQTRHTTSAQAAAGTILLRIDREDFPQLLENSRLAMRVLASLSKSLRALDLRFSAEDRLREKAPQPGVEVAEISRIIQRGLLPKSAPRLNGFDVAAGTNLVNDSPGNTIWDHFRLRDGRVGLASLSVQGGGLPAAHYLAITRGLLREIAQDHESLRGLLARVNSGLSVAGIEGMDQFVEAGVLLPFQRSVEWVGAGRCPGAILRRNGVFEEFSTHGPPLGMLDGFEFATQSMELSPGDAVIVLSQAPPGVFRGAADLAASLQGKPVAEVVATIHRALGKALPETCPETSVLFVRKQ
jgi:CRP-like cAMP-binding protein